MNKRRWSVLGVCGAMLLIIFLTTLVPIGLVSAYDRMDFDDYDYSVLTHAAVRDDGSALGLLRAAGQTVSDTYQNWQGTYSAVFLFSLQPAIWGQGWYAVTPWILIGALVLGLGCFTYAIFVVALRQDRRVWLLVWMLTSILCVQFPRDPSEGFFWYNGGMFYTFFFGLLLIWLALIVDLANRQQATRTGGWLRGVALALLGGIIAGGNYPTALLLGVLLIGYLLWSILNRKAILPVLILSLVVYGIGFALNVLAPGNSVRQALLEQQTPIRAVLSAITGTPVRLLGQLLRHPGVLAMLLLVWTPLSVILVQRVERRFRLPLLIPVASFLMLAAMFTPSYYAMSNAGSYRLWNIVMFAFYLLLMLNIFYFIGWWKHRFPASYGKTLALLLQWKQLAPVYLLLTVCLSLAFSGVGPSLGIERESPTSIRALEALQDGSAKAYAEAFDRQADAIEQCTCGEALVQPIPEPCTLLPDGDLTRYIPMSYEPSRWYNRDLKMERTE
ncbi:MAG: DUF6056 family protein [Christensenella sp.]|nr:DUF6056 family protein [Christensenella sp.]